MSSSGSRILGSVETTDGDTAVDTAVGLTPAVCVSATVARVRSVDVELAPSPPLDELDEADDSRSDEPSEEPEELESDSRFIAMPASESENKFRPGVTVVNTSDCACERGVEWVLLSASSTFSVVGKAPGAFNSVCSSPPMLELFVRSCVGKSSSVVKPVSRWGEESVEADAEGEAAEG